MGTGFTAAHRRTKYLALTWTLLWSCAIKCIPPVFHVEDALVLAALLELKIFGFAQPSSKGGPVKCVYKEDCQVSKARSRLVNCGISSCKADPLFSNRKRVLQMT